LLKNATGPQVRVRAYLMTSNFVRAARDHRRLVVKVGGRRLLSQLPGDPGRTQSSVISGIDAIATTSA
jgi:hypothetical protein